MFSIYLETFILLLLDGSYKILGIFRESLKFWLFSRCYRDGNGDNPHDGDFRGKIPDKPRNLGMGTGQDFLKVLGKLWGRGQSQFWGVKSPEIFVFRGGDKSRILGDFTIYRSDVILLTIKNANKIWSTIWRHNFCVCLSIRHLWFVIYVPEIFDVIHLKGKASLLFCRPGEARQYPRSGYFLGWNNFFYN